VLTRGISEGKGELITLTVRTGHTRVITKFGGPPQDARWSPDGADIAFTTGYGDLYVIHADGTALQRVTRSGGPCVDERPTWSPDASHLLFYRDCEQGGRPGIYLVDVDGTGATSILQWKNGISGLSWSPDGTRIVFSGFLRDSHGIYVATADGSEIRRLTNAGGDPIWSPDGGHILFERDNQIWVMPSSGGTPTQVTHLKGLQLSYWTWFPGT
jgi:Tol biopolymer transport system component